MCNTCHLRIGKGDVNNSNPPEITDAPVVKA
jgi:ferredoxin